VTAVLERLAGAAYDLAALGATDEATAFYAARGWQLWRGPSSALTPAGSSAPRRRTATPGSPSSRQEPDSSAPVDV